MEKKSLMKWVAKARHEVVTLLQQRINLEYFQNLSFEFNDIDYSDKFCKFRELKLIFR